MHGILGCAFAGLTAIAATAGSVDAQRTGQPGAGSAAGEVVVPVSGAKIGIHLTTTAHARTSFALEVNATRVDARAWTGGGSAMVAARTNAGTGTTQSLNAGVGVTRSSSGATFTVADTLPAVEWSSSTLTLGGARAAAGATATRREKGADRTERVVRNVSPAAWVRIGDDDNNPRLPAPRGVQSPSAGMTRLSIRAGDARTVDLFGDWNSWTPSRARRAANGVWYVDVPLAAGEYRYAFRVNEVEWRVPEGTTAVNDGFGGKSAYVIVALPAIHLGAGSQEFDR